MTISEKDWIASLSRDRPVLIAGPTASGKSALALKVAEHVKGPIVNADALQVFSDWRILTARPSPEDEAAHPHKLYGHVPGNASYSVGHWLRDIRPLLTSTPIIVGGTGLYFSALTEGLADIPPTPDHIRQEAMKRVATGDIQGLLDALDPDTRTRIDQHNPMRIQRAWEVAQSTGKGLAAWQDATPDPDLPLTRAQAVLLQAPKDWLTPRIERRFTEMIDAGALDEVRDNVPAWRPDLPSAKAIGARELVAHVKGEMSLDAAIGAAIVQTRQYAKRQRNWFRSRMQNWTLIDASAM